MRHRTRDMIRRPVPASPSTGTRGALKRAAILPALLLPTFLIPALLLAPVLTPNPSSSLHAQQQKLKVMTSLTTYADIAREIGGDRAEVKAIGSGRENPHHIQPTPGLVLEVRRADMLVTTGLDLELWLPALMDRANNPRITSGAPGLVSVSQGVKLLDVPATLSRSEGDSHIYGNHHIWTEPANGVIIARNILAGYKRVDPQNAAYYQERFDDWQDRLMRAYVGDELVDLLGVEDLVALDNAGELWGFLNEQSFEGRPLVDRVGGWLQEGLSMRGREVLCYHKLWSYFSRSFGVTCAEYIEPRPGIPPTPRHVAQVIERARDRNISVIVSENYYDQEQIRMVAARTGATPVVVPMNVDGAPGVDSFIDLVSFWVRDISAAFRVNVPTP
jgi:zinc/manganese transport system substrate-binding protein